MSNNKKNILMPKINSFGSMSHNNKFDYSPYGFIPNLTKVSNQEKLINL
jgi:hypothetical protein